MKQVLLAWIEQQIEGGADGKPLELLTAMRGVTQERGLEGLKEYLSMEALFNSLTGEQFDGGVAVGLIAGVEWLLDIEAANTVEAVA